MEESSVAKILVLYHSNSGRTKNMAQWVAQGASSLNEHTVRTLSIEQATVNDIDWCDGISVGSPTNLGAVAWQMKQFWDNISHDLWGKIDGKIACSFSSAGSYGGGNELTCLNLLIILMNFGFLTFGVTDYAAEAFSSHYGAIAAGESNSQEEQAACILLGKRLAQWCAYYVNGQDEHHPRYECKVEAV